MLFVFLPCTLFFFLVLVIGNIEMVEATKKIKALFDWKKTRRLGLFVEIGCNVREAGGFPACSAPSLTHQTGLLRPWESSCLFSVGKTTHRWWASAKSAVKELK